MVWRNKSGCDVSRGYGWELAHQHWVFPFPSLALARQRIRRESRIFPGGRFCKFFVYEPVKRRTANAETGVPSGDHVTIVQKNLRQRLTKQSRAKQRDAAASTKAIWLIKKNIFRLIDEMRIRPERTFKRHIRFNWALSSKTKHQCFLKNCIYIIWKSKILNTSKSYLTRYDQASTFTGWWHFCAFDEASHKCTTRKNCV